MGRSTWGRVALVVTLLAGGVAHADLLAGEFELQLGGTGGLGLSGKHQAEAFYKDAAGLTYGFRLGAEVLLVDLWVSHHQFIGSGGLAGTWTRFMTGLDTQFGLGKRRNPKIDERGYFYGGSREAYVEVAGALGYGVGTTKQVSLPLDNAQISDKGFLVHFAVGGGYHINKYISVGGTIPVELGLLFKNDVAVNEGAFYTALQFGFLLHLRAHIALDEAFSD